jgi:hypothetical protein
MLYLVDHASSHSSGRVKSQNVIQYTHRDSQPAFKVWKTCLSRLMKTVIPIMQISAATPAITRWGQSVVSMLALGLSTTCIVGLHQRGSHVSLLPLQVVRSIHIYTTGRYVIAIIHPNVYKLSPFYCLTSLQVMVHHKNRLHVQRTREWDKSSSGHLSVALRGLKTPKNG